MKTLLVAFACIPFLAACKKDEPVPVTTVPAVVAPAETATPAASTPTAAQSMESPPVTTTTPEPASNAVGSSAPAAMQGSGGGKYVVEKGDTLWSIAEKNGIKHGDLAKWNNINDPRELQVGRELMLAAP